MEKCLTHLEAIIWLKSKVKLAIWEASIPLRLEGKLAGKWHSQEALVGTGVAKLPVIEFFDLELALRSVPQGTRSCDKR